MTGLRELADWWAHQGARRVAHQERAWGFCVPLISCQHFVHLAALESFLYNKPVRVRKALPWVLGVILLNYHTQGGHCGSLKFYSWLVRGMGDLEIGIGV